MDHFHVLDPPSPSPPLVALLHIRSFIILYNFLSNENYCFVIDRSGDFSLHLRVNNVSIPCILFRRYRCLPSLGKYCNEFNQRVARQQLRKHGQTRNNRGSFVFRIRVDVTTVDNYHVACIFCRSDRRSNRFAE
jgi:hypothetical protein